MCLNTFLESSSRTKLGFESSRGKCSDTCGHVFSKASHHTPKYTLKRALIDDTAAVKEPVAWLLSEKSGAMSKNSGKLLICGQSCAGCSLERVQKVICTNSLDSGACETITFLNIRKCCAFCLQAAADDGQRAPYYFKQCLCLCRTDASSPAAGGAAGGGFCSGSGCR